MGSSAPETVVAIYRVKAARMNDFLGLLRQHHPTLRKLGLATSEPPVIYRGEEDRGGGPIVFEIFTWSDGEAAETAHHTPEVARIWEAMDSMVEERDGRPQWEFPHVQKIEP